MAILTFPAITPAKSSWGLKSITETFTSPLNGAIQTAGRLGARWKATLDFYPLDATQSRLMEGFLTQVDGMAGRFYLPAHHRLGTGAACSVNGPNQVGSSLLITAAANRTFLIGDYFSVNGEFKVLTAAVTADAAGSVTIQFAPMLRVAPPSGTTLIFTQPTILAMLSTDEFSMSREPGALASGLSLACVEVF